MKRWEKGLKRIAAVLLSALLAVNPANVSSFVAFAAAEETAVLVGDTYLYTETYYQTDADGNITAGGSETDYNVYLVKEADKYVLTLNDATIQGVDNVYDYSGKDAAIYYNGYGNLPIEIVLEGESTVTAGMMASGNAVAVMVDCQTLTIKGDGTLVAISDTYALYEEGHKNEASYAIRVVGIDEGDNPCGMKIEGGTVYAIAGDAEFYSYAIGTSGDVEIAGGNLFVNYYNNVQVGGGSNTDVSAGIFSEGNNSVITITDGQVVAYGGEAENSSGAIYSWGSVNILGGEIEAYGGDVNSSISGIGASAGIGANEDISISGGQVVANGGNVTGGNSHGIGADGDISISGDAVVEANGGNAAAGDSYGVGGRGDVTISGEAQVEAASGDASEDSIGIGTEGDLDISDDTSVQANGSGASNGKSCGIGTQGNIDISGNASIDAAGGNAENGSSIGIGAEYDAEGNRVTITIGDNADVEAYGGDAAEGMSYGIAVTGNMSIDGNTDVHTESGESKAGSVAILTFGDLDINGAAVDVTSKASSNGPSYGLGIKGELNMDGADVTAKSSTAVSGNSTAIGAIGIVNIKASIVEANGDEALNGNSYGIASETGINITDNSSVNASGNEAKLSFGIGTEGSININDSDIQANSGNATDGNSNGIGSEKNIVITGSDIEAAAGTASGFSFGIGALGTINITDSRYKLSGETGSLGAMGGSDISNSIDVSLENEDDNNENYKSIKPNIWPMDRNTFTDSLEIKMACAELGDSNIYYTTDGTEPTTDSTLYTGTFTITETTTIKAMAVWGDWAPSDVETVTYTKVSADDSDDYDSDEDDSDEDDSDDYDEGNFKDYAEDSEEDTDNEINKAIIPYGYWRLDEIGWWYEYSAGGYAAGNIVADEAGVPHEIVKWEYINGAWFAFGADGYAKFGWIFDITLNGWFYVDVNAGMKTGWQMVGGKWYYLNPVSDGTMGKMYADTMTPDGYYVDETGAWVE